MTMPLHFVLVRHGQSEGNVARNASRKGDNTFFTSEFSAVHSSQYRLTQRGRHQAALAGKWIIKNIGATFHRYYVSEYVRAVETAALLDLPKAIWYKTPFLRERDIGDWDGLNEQERAEDYARHTQMKENDAYYWKPPNGESMVDLCLRLHRVLDTLHRQSSDSSVIATCHGEVMWGFRILFERIPQSRFNSLRGSKNPFDRIHNGQVIHYTRRNPVDPLDVRPHLTWMRSVCTSDESLSLPESDWWQEIKRPVYSNDDLLAEAELILRHFENL